MLRKVLLLIVLLVLVLFVLAQRSSQVSALPAPALDTPNSETAVLAGGCFWGVQGVFEHVKGVTKVVSGYSGGDKSTATYKQVTTETTGHAESVEITYDPKVVSYGTLLRIFFSVVHNPTELNRQGPDVGPSYRSQIFTANPEQEKVAKAYIAQLTTAKAFASPIVTRVEPLAAFYPAEDYHQQYLKKNPTQPYIVIHDLPKIRALKAAFPELYRDLN